MSLWDKYRGISPKTRIYLGLGVMAYGAVALYISDQTEEKLGWTPTEKDKEDLKSVLPKITVVDRDR